VYNEETYNMEINPALIHKYSFSILFKMLNICRKSIRTLMIIKRRPLWTCTQVEK
jgi:hypothetical protein